MIIEPSRTPDPHTGRRDTASADGDRDPDPALGLDLGDVRIARRAPAEWRAWNDVGVLISADVHVARRLGTLSGEADGPVLLGAALAVRALRLGHVCLDLASVARTATSEFDPDVEVSTLPWPEPQAWRAQLEASPMVSVGDAGRPDRPLRLVGDRLYLDRYWRQERQVAADLCARADRRALVDGAVLRAGLDRLWPERDDGSDEQRLAATVAVNCRFAVIAGGPGTGKTTTVARILALLAEAADAAGLSPPRVALAAPTGRAAARLEEAVRGEARNLDVAETTRDWLTGLTSATLHRLLGRRPDSDSRFRHDHRYRLPHDTVIVDETSMVSLSLMANLLDALRPEARLILVGDPEQLASVEAGAVLGDIVGPATTERPAPLEVGTSFDAARPLKGPAIGDGIVVLRRVRRFGGGIASLAAAVQAGDADAAVALLQSTAGDLTLVEPAAEAALGAHHDAGLRLVRETVIDTFASVAEASARGDGAGALHHLSAVRVLCAHRQGPAGVASWNERIEGWLRGAIPRFGTGGAWYVGRPLLVTTNDYELRLFNGDTGVVAIGPDGAVAAAFEQRGEVVWISPGRLPVAETLYATTVHKSQGSQYDGVIVVLPEPTSPILTRQLLYTAVTRARGHVTVVGSVAAVREAITRPISRASGLQERLWGTRDLEPDRPAKTGGLTAGGVEHRRTGSAG